MDVTQRLSALAILRRGDVLDLEGIQLIEDEGKIRPGDLYVAERNTGPKLLTAKRIDSRGWILSTCNSYPYEISECVRVKEFDPDQTD